MSLGELSLLWRGNMIEVDQLAILLLGDVRFLLLISRSCCVLQVATMKALRLLPPTRMFHCSMPSARACCDQTADEDIPKRLRLTSARRHRVRSVIAIVSLLCSASAKAVSLI